MGGGSCFLIFYSIDWLRNGGKSFSSILRQIIKKAG